MHRPILAVLLPLFLGLTARQIDAQNLNDTISPDPRVTINTLENGLRYYIHVNRQPANRAALWLVVNAGSNLEEDDQQGLAHFLEHMAFNSTQNFPQEQALQYLQSIGLGGPDLNAFTSFDETVYLLQVPTDDEVAMATVFQILEDWAHNITLTRPKSKKSAAWSSKKRGWEEMLLAASATSCSPCSTRGRATPSARPSAKWRSSTHSK